MKKFPNHDLTHPDVLTQYGTNIKMLQVLHGDSFILKTKKGDEEGLIVVDGGPGKSDENEFYREIIKYPSIDLMVMTHPDSDHIDGILNYVKQNINSPLFPVKELWANCPEEPLWRSDSNCGIKDGVRLSVYLSDLVNLGKLNWRHDITIESKIDCPFADIVILNPWPLDLKEYEEKYEGGYLKSKFEGRKVDDSKRIDKDFNTQLETLASRPYNPPKHINYNKAANLASIAFILNCDYYSILMLADSYPHTICQSLKEMGVSEENPLKVDFIKVAHHGSANNISNELLSLVRCQNFLIPTNGGKGISNHPDRETLARILCNGVGNEETKINIFFNYSQEIMIQNKGNWLWNENIDKGNYNFEFHFPEMSQIQPKLNHIPQRELHQYPSSDMLRDIAVSIYGKEGMLGSGILVKDRAQFKVITAAHCVKDEKDNKLDAETLTICTSASKDHAEKEEIRIKEIVVFLPEDDKDMAILLVDADSPGYKYLSWHRPFKIVNENIYGADRTFSMFTYRICKPEGEIFRLSKSNENEYRIEDYLEKGNGLESLQGVSGSGVFTMFNHNLYCVGYVKRHTEGEGQLANVEIRKIPNYFTEDLWIDKLDIKELRDNYLETLGNSNKYEYQKAWETLYNNLEKDQQDAERHKNLTEKIREIRRNYPIPQYVGLQRSVMELIFSRLGKRLRENPKVNRPEDYLFREEVEILALSLADMGLWPDLFEILHPFKNYIEENIPDKSFITKRHFLIYNPYGSNFGEGEETDERKYENILSAAFRLEFAEMKKLVENWNPDPENKDYLIKKIFLDSLWEVDQYREKLSQLITEAEEKRAKDDRDLDGFSLEEQFIAKVIYNISRKEFLDKSIDYNFLNGLGVASPGDYIKVIFKDMNKKTVRKAVVPYGVNPYVMMESPDIDSITSAIRLIGYLKDTGLPPNSRYGMIVNENLWHEVFLKLFRSNTECMVYYTLYYQGNVVKKCAQDVAFSEDPDVIAKRPVILRALLKALTYKETPEIFTLPILTFLIQLLRIEKEEVWIEELMDILHNWKEGKYKIGFNYIDSQSPVFEMLSVVASLLTDKENIKTFIKWLIEQEAIITAQKSYLISLMDIESYITQDECLNTLVFNHIFDWPLSEVYPLGMKLYSIDSLKEEISSIIESKISNEGLEEMARDHGRLAGLSKIVQNSKIVDSLKDSVLKSNIWETGIEDNRISSNVVLIAMSEFDENVVWTDSELSEILNNLENNLDKMRVFVDRYRHYIWQPFPNLISILLDMKYFLLRLKGKYDLHRPDLEKRIDETLKTLTSVEGLYSYLHSRDLQNYFIGLDLLGKYISKEGVEKYKREIDSIITRISLGIKEGMTESVGFICGLVKDYSDKMIEFKPTITIALRRVYEFDHESYNFDALTMREYLRTFFESIS